MQYENKGRFIVKFKDIPTSRTHQIELEAEERKQDYREAELGFDEERALREAKRCLSCRRCLGCALCWAECKPEAIQFDLPDEVFEIEADSVIISPGVERALDRIDKKYSLAKETNVITDLQLERMLNDNGPTVGMVIRPYDGEVPASVAFVQTFDKAGANLAKAAMTFAANEAALLRKKLPKAQITMFAPALADVPEAKKALETAKIDMENSAVQSVAIEETASVKVSGENGAKTFDLVVLVTQPSISKDARDLTKALGLSLTYAEFLAGEAGGLIKTEKEPVQLAVQA